MSNTDSITIRPDFKEKLTSFFAGCQRIHAQYCAARGYSDDTKWNMTWLKRYVRVEQSISGSSSCHSFCFVDIDSGEVLKTGGWKAPAITKTKRGNIFDEHNGLQHIGPYGVFSANEIKQTETPNVA